MQGDVSEFDVAVIGAGINGAGIARDAALRGLRVLVLDKNDMCSGTSAVSSRLIHGGLRYLEYGEVPLVYESLHERRSLRRTAEHLVKPLRISIPIYAGAKRGPFLIRLGMIAYDILSFRKRLPNHEMLSGEEMLQQEPGLNADGLRAAARYSDAQVTFAERLVLENLLAARAAGAVIKTYAEVSEIRCDDKIVRSLVYRERDGTVHEANVATVVNAAGPWVDRVLATASDESKRLVGGTKGSHIVVAPFDGAPTDAFYVEAVADGRPIFIIPWNSLYLIGTTDIRYDGDVDTIRASREEVDYLLAETNRVFPQANLGVESIHFAYAGVRPLPHRDKGPESAITRRHVIKHNRRVGKGLLSIVGGKLTTYRSLAEQTVDRVAKILRRRLPECRTADTTLPGVWGQEEARASLLALGILSDDGVDRLLQIYGGRAAMIAALASENTYLQEPIGVGNRLISAEIVFVIRDEFAQTLVDIVFRRTMLGFESDQGRAVYADIAEVAAGELTWTDAEVRGEMANLTTYANSLRQ